MPETPCACMFWLRQQLPTRRGCDVWAFLATPIGQLVLSLIIALLRKIGAVNMAEALAMRVAAKLAEIAANAKVDPTYPTGKFGQPKPPVSEQAWKNEPPPPAVKDWDSGERPPVGNWNTGATPEHDDDYPPMNNTGPRGRHG